jgi:large subunit ribosomal protein L9
MRVLLLKDVYNLGRAGDVKKVADGYGRNFLLPQKLAVLATPGAMKQAEHIRKIASEQRAALNQELSVVAERLEGVELTFPVKAGETGRLYGSVTTSMIAEALTARTGVEIDRRQVESQPIKLLGVHSAIVRLTIDLLPEIRVVVHREGEPPESVFDEEVVAEEVPAGDFAELQAELDAMEGEEEAVAEGETSAVGQSEIEAEAPDLSGEHEQGDTSSETELQVDDEINQPMASEEGEPEGTEETEPVERE